MAFEVDVQSGPAILMGYSLGGRLALQALLKEPARWKAAVIISAHPGLLHGVDDPEKKARFLSDQHWAKHILEDPWEDWVLRWNQQSVFHRGGASLLRRECDFSRTQLARLLMHFSLGKQGDLRSELSHLKVPILWISGEYDARYQNIVHEMSLLNPHFQKGIVLGAGHRVPWDRPVEFREQMILFLKKICVQIE
jgi:2-succinyl-6-hydroxy-2,4-cyclohexadiene-1-carboxylate synthase